MLAATELVAEVVPTEIVPAWDREVQYETILKYPGVRDTIERHARQAPKRLSGEQFLKLADKLVQPLIPGDYDGDDDVDAADYVQWRRLLNTNVLAADGNQDGQINSHDYAVWRAHFGQTAGSGSEAIAYAATVPEPGTAVLLIVGVVAIVRLFAW